MSVARGLRDQFVDSGNAGGLARSLQVPGSSVQKAQPELGAPLPCVPLTDRQYADYQVLMSGAAALNAAGRSEEAKRMAHIAANILRTSAPALE